MDGFGYVDRLRKVIRLLDIDEAQTLRMYIHWRNGEIRVARTLGVKGEPYVVVLPVGNTADGGSVFMLGIGSFDVEFKVERADRDDRRIGFVLDTEPGEPVDA